MLQFDYSTCSHRHRRFDAAGSTHAYVGTSANVRYGGLPEVLGSGMEFCSLVRSFWVSLSSRSRMSTYCLYLFMSQGMPARGNSHPIIAFPIAKTTQQTR